MALYEPPADTDPAITADGRLSGFLGPGGFVPVFGWPVDDWPTGVLVVPDDWVILPPATIEAGRRD